MSVAKTNEWLNLLERDGFMPFPQVPMQNEQTTMAKIWTLFVNSILLVANKQNIVKNKNIE